MAVTQGEVVQQPPAPAPGQGPSAASNPRSASASQRPAGQTQLGTGGNITHAQGPSPALSFSQIIEQQISQAIQPVLDEFRHNVAQTMDAQMALAPSIAGGTSEGIVQTAPQGQAVQQPSQPQGVLPAGQQPVQPQGSPAAGQQLVGQAIQQAQPQQAQSPLQAPAQPPQQQGQRQAQPSGPDGQAGAQQSIGNQPGMQAQSPVTGALSPVLQAVEHQGAQWLQSVLVAGLGALLSEATHQAIQQRAEQGLHALLQRLFEAAPDTVTSPEMQAKTERTLQAILRESLDTIFVGGMRNTVQQGGQQAIQQSLHGEFGSALKGVEDTCKAMAEALLTVLRNHWQSVLRLLLALALLALENSLAQSNTHK